MKQTAVEWLGNEIDNELKVIDNLYGNEMIGRKIAFAFVKRILIEAKEMEKEQKILLVEQLKDYTKESQCILGNDEREASEFVDIFYQKYFKSE